MWDRCPPSQLELTYHPDVTDTLQWLVEERERRGMSRAELARAIGVSHVTIGNWERGNTSPNPEMLQRATTFLTSSQAPTLPKAVADAALQLLEWATSPVMLPREDVADEETLEHLRQLLDGLPEAQASTLRSMLGQAVIARKRKRAYKRRSNRFNPWNIDGVRFLAECDRKGRDPDEVRRQAEKIMEPYWQDKEHTDARHNAMGLHYALAKALDVPVPHIIYGHEPDEVVLEKPQEQHLITRWHLLSWMKELNYTVETLAEDMAMDATELRAIFEHRCDPTWVFLERFGIGTREPPGIISWPFRPQWLEDKPGGRWAIDPIVLAEVMRSDPWVPDFRCFSNAEYAFVLGISEEELERILDGTACATPDLARRAFRDVPNDFRNRRVVVLTPGS